MTTINTSTDRVTPEEYPTLFGVKMSLKKLGRSEGATYEGVRCWMMRFNSYTGEYTVRCEVSCPQCDHYPLEVELRSSSDLTLREIRARILSKGPCNLCKQVEAGEIDKIQSTVDKAEADLAAFVELLTSPDGVAPKVTRDWNDYRVKQNDDTDIFLPGSGERVVYPTWLQGSDDQTLRQLTKLFRELVAFAAKRRGEVKTIRHPKLGWVGFSFRIPFLPRQFHINSSEDRLQELKEHRKRMRAVERANKARRSKKSD
jgi:hypothetical protein